jgi:DNA-binding PadR family transcriptional regulator
MDSDLPQLTASERCIIGLLLTEGAEKFGLQLVAEGDGALARSSIYVVLDRMQQKGLIESRAEEKVPDRPGIPRRMYKLTGKGRYAMTLHRQWQEFLRGQEALGNG